jgi:hypothetical protein
VRDERGGLALVTVLALAAAAAPVCADGGVVSLRADAGAVRITLLCAPAPLRQGPVELAVLLQDRASGEPILDADVALRLVPAGGGTPIAVRAVRGTDANRLLYAARFALPAPGRFRVAVRAAGTGFDEEAEGELRALPPASVWRLHWPALALPVAGIALLALHQFLSLRRSSRVHSRPGEHPV